MRDMVWLLWVSNSSIKGILVLMSPFFYAVLDIFYDIDGAVAYCGIETKLEKELLRQNRFDCE